MATILQTCVLVSASASVHRTCSVSEGIADGFSKIVLIADGFFKVSAKVKEK